jgi:hypothetical protein
MLDTVAGKLEYAWSEGVRRFVAKYGEQTLRVTAKEFAWKAFVVDLKAKVNHPAFAREAPEHAYFLLVLEHSKFNQYAR